MTFISWMILLPRNDSIFNFFFSECYYLGSWLIQLASPRLEIQVHKDTREVYGSPFSLIAYKGLPLAAAILAKICGQDNLAITHQLRSSTQPHTLMQPWGTCRQPRGTLNLHTRANTRASASTPVLHTQCWLLGTSVLRMQGRADKEFEFLAGLSVKVIKPLLMHPFVVAVSSSVTFIKYVQLNVTES